MKKDVTETRVFCDFCEGAAHSQCLVCGKDICKDHELVLEIHLDRPDKGFRAHLCPVDAQPLLPILNTFKSKSKTWEQVGHNPEYNEARLKEILDFLEKAQVQDEPVQP